MRFSTFSTGFSTTKGISPIRTVIQAAAFWKVLDENAGILPFIKKKVEGFSLHSTNRSRAAIYFSPIWNEPVTSFQHWAAAVFLCGKGGENCSFPHCFIPAEPSQSPAATAPPKGELFAITETYRMNAKSFRQCYKLPLRGSCLRPTGAG